MALFHSMMFMLFMILVSPSQSSSSFLRVPPNKFVDSAKEVSTILQQLHSILSPLTNTSGLPNGIHDCLDLLDMSSEQLRMSMSATQNPKAGTIGNLLISSELRTRLSAVLVNSVTCIEGLEGLEVKGVVSTGLYSAMSLVDNNLLAQVIPVPRDQLDIDNRGFPSWINEEDKKMLRGNRVTPDVAVATDGSGHYRNVMEAVLAIVTEFLVKPANRVPIRPYRFAILFRIGTRKFVHNSLVTAYQHMRSSPEEICLLHMKDEGSRQNRKKTYKETQKKL